MDVFSLYTLASDEMTEAMTESLPEKYPMELNRSDMEALITGLASAWTGNPVGDDEMCDRIMSLYSGIAQTLGIEGV